MYIRRKGAGLMGFGGAESCGPTQQWDPNCTFAGIKGQCVPTGMVGKAPGCTYSSSEPSIWDKLLSAGGDVLKAKLTPAPVTNITTTSSEMSTTTKVAIAGAGVLALLLILKSRKS